MQAIKLYRSKSVALGWTEGVCQSIQSKCPELSAQAQFAFGACAPALLRAARFFRARLMHWGGDRSCVSSP